MQSNFEQYLNSEPFEMSYFKMHKSMSQDKHYFVVKRQRAGLFENSCKYSKPADKAFTASVCVAM